MDMKDRNRRGWACLAGASSLIMAAALFALGAFSAEEAKEEIAPALRMVFVPFNGKEGTIKRFAPLTDKLGEKLGQKVEPICYETYDEVFERLSSGEFELAFLTPLTYAQISESAKLTVIAKELYGPDQEYYYSMLIAPAVKDPDKKDKGITLAFTSPHSTSGYLVPQMFFKFVVRTPPEKFAKEVVFTGSHQKVIIGVHNGKYDIGATSDVDIKRAVETGLVPAGAFSTIPIPGAPLCARADLDPERKKKIQSALISINQDKKVLEAISLGGIGPAVEKEYEVMFKLKKMLESK